MPHRHRSGTNSSHRRPSHLPGTLCEPKWNRYALSAIFQYLDGSPIQEALPVETLNCDPGSVFAHSSTFAGCCSIGGNCNFPTACARGTVTNRLGNIWTCELKRGCYTMTVCESYPSATDTWVVRNCVDSWSASTVYRSLPLSMTVSSTSSGSSLSMAASPTDSMGDTATDVGSPAASTTDGNTVGNLEPSYSHAWAAGVAIGCLAAGALFGGGFGFWIGRRRRRDADEDGPQMAFTVQDQTFAVADGIEVKGRGPEKRWVCRPQEAPAGVMSIELDAAPNQQGQSI